MPAESEVPAWLNARVWSWAVTLAMNVGTLSAGAAKSVVVPRLAAPRIRPAYRPPLLSAAGNVVNWLLVPGCPRTPGVVLVPSPRTRPGRTGRGMEPIGGVVGRVEAVKKNGKE